MTSANLFRNIGANATLNVKAGPAQVYSASCHNANASARYLQFHNTITIPADQAVPFLSFLVPAGAHIVLGTDYFTNFGFKIPLGLAFAFSTTRDTYTAGTASDQFTVISFT